MTGAQLMRLAIHMFFDCLGIGVGLWASIAATWKPDGRYTFGYGRVETLSGFANGMPPLHLRGETLLIGFLADF